VKKNGIYMLKGIITFGQCLLVRISSYQIRDMTQKIRRSCIRKKV